MIRKCRFAQFCLHLVSAVLMLAVLASHRITAQETLAYSDRGNRSEGYVRTPALGDPERAVELAERAVRLNPRYPDWYIQGLRYIYLFAGHFDKSLEFVKQLKNPFALDYAIMAIDQANLGNDADAKSAVANVLRLDPAWSAEGWISSQGGFARERETDLFANGARKAGLPMCVPEEKLKEQPNLLRLKACDEQRAKGVSG
jgi:tetratricopeptide (TPR) repeat protein